MRNSLLKTNSVIAEENRDFDLEGFLNVSCEDVEGIEQDLEQVEAGHEVLQDVVEQQDANIAAIEGEELPKDEEGEVIQPSEEIQNLPADEEQAAEVIENQNIQDEMVMESVAGYFGFLSTRKQSAGKMFQKQLGVRTGSSKFITNEERSSRSSNKQKALQAMKINRESFGETVKKLGKAALDGIKELFIKFKEFLKNLFSRYPSKKDLDSKSSFISKMIEKLSSGDNKKLLEEKLKEIELNDKLKGVYTIVNQKDKFIKWCEGLDKVFEIFIGLDGELKNSLAKNENPDAAYKEVYKSLTERLSSIDSIKFNTVLSGTGLDKSEYNDAVLLMSSGTGIRAFTITKDESKGWVGCHTSDIEVTAIDDITADDYIHMMGFISEGLRLAPSREKIKSLMDQFDKLSQTTTKTISTIKTDGEDKIDVSGILQLVRQMSGIVKSYSETSMCLLKLTKELSDDTFNYVIKKQSLSK